jgi:hypothetical protein
MTKSPPSPTPRTPPPIDLPIPCLSINRSTHRPNRWLPRGSQAQPGWLLSASLHLT